MSTGPVTFNARNNAGTVINMNCSSVSASGSARRGTGVNPVASIGSTAWAGCAIPGWAFTVQQRSAWSVTGTGANATAATTDSIAGFVGQLHKAWTTTANPRACSFTVLGQADTSFNEATQHLVVNEVGHTGKLRLSNVSGCLGQLQSGNPADLQFTLKLTSDDGTINLH